MTASTFDFWGWFDKVTEAAKASPVGKILTAQGWDVAHTGGGCLAWEKNTDKAYVYITFGNEELGEHVADPETETWAVGVYSVDINQNRFSMAQDIVGVTAALAKAEAMLANPDNYYEP
jgi:hypothetical protein